MKLALLCAVILLPFSGFSQTSKPRLPYGSGNDYLAVCGPVDDKQDLTPSEDRDFIACVSYFKGLHDGVEELANPKPYCVPDEVTFHQAGRVLLKYMKDNPAKLHLPVSTLYISAMKDAFPCSK